MNFNSLDFAWFMPLVFAVYWLVLGRSWRAQNVWILVMSYLFYGWWDWRFCFLLSGATIVTFACALPATHRKLWTTVAVCANLANLVFFKYFHFFGNGLRRLFEVFGWMPDWFTIDILLPVGISFFTFQAISYSVDVYRGETLPTRNFVAFAGFISFFPQLVAGPIERSTQLLPQFLERRTWDYARAVRGMRLILWGLFKKCAVADGLIELVNLLWNDWSDDMSSRIYFRSAICFAIQIYADFSGYCDIARGAAALLGFKLSVNFQYPYFSRNIIEFWHRWHISLMNWFTKYVYIPIGGSRRGNRYLNVLVVFLLSGLWHGANLTFVIWGLLCGLLYIAALAGGARRYRPADTPPADRKDMVGMIVTFLLLALSWVFFRAPDLHYAMRAFALLGPESVIMAALCIGVGWLITRLPRKFNFTIIFALLTVAAVGWVIYRPDPGITAVFMRRGMFAAILMFMVEWRGRHNSFALESMPRNRYVRLAAYLALYLIIITAAADTDEPFLYFQF
ncbi:MAG: MBOAT family protein [Muribaculaceae bacterium]|nr:MBOAT family protein [Muribaculaceae bacterium]